MSQGEHPHRHVRGPRSWAGSVIHTHGLYRDDEFGHAQVFTSRTMYHEPGDKHDDEYHDAPTKCVFGCGEEGTVDLSDARHVGIGFGCMTCTIRAARKKLVERRIKEARKGQQ